MMKSALKKPRFWVLTIAILLVLLCLPACFNVALTHYAETGQNTMVDHLLAVGVAPSDDALGTAAYNGHTAVVRSLLTAGGNPNAMNDLGETALAYAAENGHTRIVKLMLAYGADPNWGCREMDPLTCARMGNYAEIVKLLKRAGAKD